MREAPLDARAIFEALAAHDVQYVLIGGLAAAVHGSPLLTSDMDITPERASDNLARLSDALRELDAKVRAAELDEPLPFSHTADSLAAVDVWNLRTRFGDLDISFVPKGTDGYPDLARSAVESQVGGVVVRVASLADVVRSKEAAGRDKDRRALPVLREILARRLHERPPADPPR
jgi:hypothetical protein